MDDPFAALGLPRRFDVDLADLHRRFIAATATTHPDRFEDPVDQAEAAERSAAVNEAYRVLKDPEARAEVYLALLGNPGDAKALPPDLLMEMMEVREELESAQESGDTESLQRLQAWAEEHRNDRLSRIAEAFRAIEAGGCPIENGKKARLELNSLRYFRRMLEQMPQAE